MCDRPQSGSGAAQYCALGRAGREEGGSRVDKEEEKKKNGRIK